MIYMLTANRDNLSAIIIALLLLFGVVSLADGETLQLDGDNWKTLDLDADSTQTLFNQIRMLCVEGEYSKANKLCNKLLLAHEKGSRRLNRQNLEQAMSLRVETLIGRKKYWSAYEASQAQLEDFPHGILSERAMNQQIDIALAFLTGAKRYLLGIIPYTSRTEALTMLRRTAERKMGSDIALRCMMITGDYYYSRQRWLDAYDAYITVQTNLAKRPEAVEAMLKAADAMYNSFEGVYWDDVPLIESEQLYKSYLAARPHSSEAARVSQRLEKIADFRAEKDYRTGLYYQRVGRDKSARAYFNEVIKRYPGSKWAADAAKEDVMVSTDNSSKQTRQD